VSDVTRILSQIESGDPQAAEQLLPLVYDELRKLAAAKLGQEKPGQTLQATALVHEAYLRLVGGGEVKDQKSELRAQKTDEPTALPTSDFRPLAPGPAFHSRGHFFAAAAEAMRRILIESARRRQQGKRGGDLVRVDLDAADAVSTITPDQLLVLDESLEALQGRDAYAAGVFKLRYFTGCSVEEAAELLGMSRATAYRHWSFARAWLLSQLRADA
jgi:RNA polymerase sigma factor (TIGR02999 family)